MPHRFAGRLVTDILLIFLTELDNRHIAYELAHHRDEAIMVTLALPGQRWEVEFLPDGSLEVEKFVSDGRIYDATALDELFEIDLGLLSDEIEDEVFVAG